MKIVQLVVDTGTPLDDGPWLMQPFGDDNHVMLEAEASMHELERACWCQPAIEQRDPLIDRLYGRGVIVIHRHGQWIAA